MATKINAKFTSFLLVLTIILSIPMSVFAQDSTEPDDLPELTSISFKNAKIDQEFDPKISDYTLTLDDPNLSPTLDSKEIKGDAKLNISYILDNNAGKQTGIKATLKYSNVSIDYSFIYSNPPAIEKTSNCNLGYITGELCEIYPELSDKKTEYTLYIPSDLTEIKLDIGTQDPNAICKGSTLITLNKDQEFTIKFDVHASDGINKKTYSFRVKRLDITCDEARQLPQGKSIISDKITAEKLSILLIVLAALVGIIALIVFIYFAKKLTVKVVDNDEVEYFEITSTTNDDSEE